MKLILASNNAGKVIEFREILAGTGIEVIPQREAGCDFEVDETGETFEENAFLKAEAAMKATGLPAVSDDSGLEVDALGGAPGVHSARYTGNHDDSDLDRRKFGFGYDAMFIADGEDRTMAEMTHEEKNEISHRGRALREFARVLKEYCNADK